MRNDIATDPVALADYVQGVWALKNTAVPNTEFSRYDWYVLWHAAAMRTMTPPTPANNLRRNAAHGGPVFLPWHRLYLKRLEAEIALALGKPGFAIPYWNWITDGQLDLAGQRNAPIWQPGALGGSGLPVSDGPFRYDTANPDDPANWVVRIEMLGRDIFLANRGLRRELGPGTFRLPNTASLTAAIARPVYDRAAYNRNSAQTFRNDLEGWRGDGLHNRVHRWIGGDMGAGHSPNDPVFFLHHCNVDRIWAFWQSREGAANYQPDDTAGVELNRHRRSDALLTLASDPLPGATVSDMFGDASAAYDSFADLQALMDGVLIA